MFAASMTVSVVLITLIVRPRATGLLLPEFGPRLWQQTALFDLADKHTKGRMAYAKLLLNRPQQSRMM